MPRLSPPSALLLPLLRRLQRRWQKTTAQRSSFTGMIHQVGKSGITKWNHGLVFACDGLEVWGDNDRDSYRKMVASCHPLQVVRFTARDGPLWVMTQLWRYDPVTHYPLYISQKLLGLQLPWLSLTTRVNCQPYDWVHDWGYHDWLTHCCCKFVNHDLDNYHHGEPVTPLS